MNCKNVIFYYVNKKFYYFIDEVENVFIENIENVYFLVGLCLYLEKRGIGFGFYNCFNFLNGCLYLFYFIEIIYICKIKVWFEKIFIIKILFF